MEVETKITAIICATFLFSIAVMSTCEVHRQYSAYNHGEKGKDSSGHPFCRGPACDITIQDLINQVEKTTELEPESDL